VNKRTAIIVLGLLLAGLQWRLWLSADGMAKTHQLSEQAEAARQENAQLEVRNAEVDAEVQDLNSGQAATEARARVSMGMIKPGETFFLVVHES
jgi:cell division protein FtsB